jgi:hypothetical protein
VIVDLEDARAERAIAMINSRLPAGCDYQGRHAARPFVDTMPVQPMPAEACTEVGADGCQPPATRLGAVLIVCTGVPLLIALISGLMSMMQWLGSAT